MLIICKKEHIDYYDNVGSQYGIDKSIIYKRDFREMSREEKYRFSEPISEAIKNIGNIFSRLRLEYPAHPELTTYYDWNLIHFCGKNYLMLKLLYESKDCRSNNIVQHLYSHEIIPVLEELAKEGAKHEKYLNKSKARNKWKDSIDAIKYLESADFSKLVHEYKIPIFSLCIHRTRDIKEKNYFNPVLKDFEFFKVKDSFSAFQELQQFISGVLGTEGNEPIVTDDKYKILAQGFDLKTSFRKDPGKPRPRKSKNK